MAGEIDLRCAFRSRGGPLGNGSAEGGMNKTPVVVMKARICVPSNRRSKGGGWSCMENAMLSHAFA
jgi:hypothetical protein